MLHRFLASLATLALLAACAPSHARPLVDVSVVDRDTGEWLSQHSHRGDVWVAGSPGHRYSVRLTNTTGERVLVVLSVDGVNAITGQTAHPSQAGYVLEPWQTTEINGWRKSMHDVAQFVFTDLGDSYAARTGRPRNVGVIGVAAFREARTYYPQYTPPPIARDRMEKRGQANDAAAAPADTSRGLAAEESMRQQSIGTGHGDREWAPTSRTSFERATRQPEQVSEVRYDDYRRLVALGVVPRRHGPIWRENAPSAFPGGFVADPPRYR
jgi:hypothetical protein